jgi:hypothetical protein
MEVHHPHHPTHKKKWSEYMLEFFMLFVAVTLGFFAENIREHIAEENKKKELLEVVAKGFKKDIETINSHINFNVIRRGLCDSLDNLIQLPNDKIEQQLYYHLMTDVIHMWKYTSYNKSRSEAEAKGYFSSSKDEELANTIHKYDYFNGELDAFFQTEMNSLSSYIDNRYYKYVNPDILKMGSGLDRKGYPHKMGIEKLSTQDIKELRVQLAVKKEVIDYEKQLYDSLSFYANKSILLIEDGKHN